MKNKIKKIFAREILSSIGTPTIETTLILTDGQKVTTSVPTGVSISKHEAKEVRDSDPKRHLGKGVIQAIANINQKIGPRLKGQDPTLQEVIDQAMIAMDGRKDKSNLGANAILSVSQAVLKAGAAVNSQPLYHYLAIRSGMKKKLPIPVFSVINGGLHGAGNLDFQEFHVIPSSQKSYSEGLRAGAEIYQNLKKVLSYRNAIHSLGDDGGFAPDLFTNADALEVIQEAIAQANYHLGKDVYLGLDVAASFFYKKGRYSIRDISQPFGPQVLINYYQKINQEYSLFYLEDPLWEDDWQNWSLLTGKMSDGTLIVGDDLLCTNPERTQKAIEQKACSAILVKPNQIGTVSEVIKVIQMAQQAEWKVVISHRSGETNDSFIADFSVGIGADYVKFGAPARGERVAKYNRLLAIEEELKHGA